MIFRDDDINKLTDVKRFSQIHQIFKDNKVLHTVAIIANGIEENEELVEILKRGMRFNRIDLQLHCFNHIDMTVNYDETEKDLTLAMETLLRVFNVRPTAFYPPWNRADDKVRKIARELGLETSNEKVSLSKYVQKDGDVGACKVINFHYWDEECMHLESAIAVYKKVNKL